MFCLRNSQVLIILSVYAISALLSCLSKQGVGGVIELAPGYLPAVYNIVKKPGGLFIADEVQTGFGQTGSHFWGFEAHGIVPDTVTMAKVRTLV
jgi:4-aminobutyrate aminotransferase-like enzyme